MVQRAGLSRRRPRVQIPSPPPFLGEIAQSVEQWTENPRVGGSIPPLTTIFCGNSSVVERHVANVNVAGSNPVSRSITE